MHLMIDLETAGTRPDAAILQIGAVLFEPVFGGKIRNDNPFNAYVAIQDDAGTIDHDTFCFWLMEAKHRMAEKLSTEAIPLGAALQRFTEWLPDVHQLPWDAIQGVWAKPSTFDIPILTSAFARFGLPVPWDWRRVLDARTMFHMIGGEPEIDTTGFLRHDAVDDAIMQAMMLQKAFGQFIVEHV